MKYVNAIKSNFMQQMENYKCKQVKVRNISFLSPLVPPKREKNVQTETTQFYKRKLFCKSKHRWLCAQKIYKLRHTKLSLFVYFSLVLREREETKTKYSATQWPISLTQKLTEVCHMKVWKQQLFLIGKMAMWSVRQKNEKMSTKYLGNF